MSKYNNKKVTVGKRLGRLLVLEDTEKRNNSKRKIFLCECDCGKKVEVDIAGLRTGSTQSCGCLRLEKMTKHASSRTKLYKKWADMLQRCNNSNSTNYKHYGKRGIKVCDEWYDFVVFKKWADKSGYKEPLSIDRIDPNGNYEPINCRWVTRKQQDRNRRDSIFVWIHGEYLHLMDVAEKYDVDYSCLKYRYHKGIRGEKLISPSQRGKSLNKYNAKKIEVDGIIFHSKAEADYYFGLKMRQAAGEISSFELQPRFTLQPAFTKNGKKFVAITYIADFLVYLPNGEVEVIDVKGMVTETFNVKRKLFEYKYPYLQLNLLKHVKKYGGFITLDEYNKLQRAEKKAKKQNQAK